MKYLIALDVGTTAVKAALFSQELQMVALAVEEYGLLTPKASFVELPAQKYWEKAICAIGKVLAGVERRDVLSITCATQGETLIPVDAAGNTLSNAVVWLDSRAQEEAQWIQETMGISYQQTGLPVVNGFTPLAKLLWFRRNMPAVYEKTEKFLLLEDYLVFRLSGKYATNPAVLCTTGYFDIQLDEYLTDVLGACGLDVRKLPPIFQCGIKVGAILPLVAQELNLPNTVAVTTGAMDQVASAIGSGNVQEGIVTETTGTCQAVAATVEKGELLPSAVTYYSHAVPGKLLKIVINQTAGIAYKWFRDEFCADLALTGRDTFDEMNNLAEKAPAMSHGVQFFPHMTGMQFPMTDEKVRGAFIGVGLDTGRECFVRAIMESVGFMLRESMEAMHLSPKRMISLGGGSKSKLWRQIKASICAVEVATLQNNQTTALGAAMLGGVAMGLFTNVEEACGRLCLQEIVQPIAEDNACYCIGYQRYLKMYERLSPLFKD